MILMDTQAVIHIAQMLLHHRDFAQISVILHQMPDLLMGRLVGKGKLDLVVDLRVAALALVLGDFGQVQLQADFLVICLEIEGTE
jgi:hypothetical protein